MHFSHNSSKLLKQFSKIYSQNQTICKAKVHDDKTFFQKYYHTRTVVWYYSCTRARATRISMQIITLM